MSETTLPAWTELLPGPLRVVLALVRPWLSPASFLMGFLLDVLTLRRVDDVGDNVQLTLYLFVAAGLLVVERRVWHGRARWAVLRRWHDWIRYGLQVVFGGLFSAYFVFYSKSATMGPSVVFVLLLAALMLVNELRFSKIRPDVPIFGLFFFCLLSYLLFALPTWTTWLGWGTRWLAAMLAMNASALAVAVVHRGPVRDPEPLSGRPAPDVRSSLAANGAIWFAMVVALFTAMRLGLVPPVPLSLAEAAIYHDLRPGPEGYVATYDAPPWYAPWRGDDSVFRYRPGDKVHCFTAVFAPRGTKLAVFHAWEQWRDGEWVQTDKIPWTMRGGRDDGWRSWTAKKHVTPGDWRVRVVTELGEELGRVRFEVVADEGPAPEQRTVVY